MKVHKIVLIFSLIIYFSFSLDIIVNYLNIAKNSDGSYNIDAYITSSLSQTPFDVNVGIFLNNTLIYNKTLYSFLVNGVYDPTEPTQYIINGHIIYTWKPSSPGMYNITVFADYNNKISETNENNNKISKIINVLSNVDLTITNISTYSNIAPGQTADVIIDIKNNGTENITKNFNVSLYANGNLVGKATINGLNAGETKQVMIQWTPTSVGTYTLKAIVDQENVISEINESNNEKSITVKIDYICNCNSCSDCNAKLNDPNCKVVILNTNISTTSSCINIQNLENKTFDCNGNWIIGPETYPTIPANQNNGNYGVEIINSKNSTLKNCYLYNFNDAIHVSNSEDISILYNTIINTSDDGIEFDYSKNNYVHQNVLINISNDAINIYKTNNTQLKSNIIKKATSSGFDISYSHYNTIDNNEIYDSGDGINLWHGSSNNTITSNKIQNVKYAIVSDDGSIGPYNIIYNNLFNVSVNYTKNINNINYWNTTLSSGSNIIGEYILGGNYWTNTNGTGYSDTCFDLDKNGICDFPLEINSNNKDYLPLAGPNAITTTPCGKCVCVNINRINRTLIYSVTNYCPVNYTVEVLLYNDYVPWRQPIKKDNVTLNYGKTIKFNKTIPDAFVGWTDFEVIVKDLNTNKIISSSGDFITNVPPKVKVDQSYLLVLLVFILISIFLIKENKFKQS